MGDSCSKLEELEGGAHQEQNGRRRSWQSSPEEHQQQQQHAHARVVRPPPPSTDPPVAKRKRAGSIRQSLVRVGSHIRRSPASPTTRASNYNHVHDAVALNFHQAASERGPSGEALGVVGLTNLGNTCFLNSSLQCLSATIPLTDYFLGYDYRSEIAVDNFLGSGGKLVTSYAELMKKMWLGSDSKSTVVTPVAFKAQLEIFAPQFKGSYQHDSQELLSFLLDGIHEDLNRVKKKPYIEDCDCDGTNDEKDAIEAWKNYLKRNKSLVVDIFQGQLKSELNCLTCGHKNIRFEPFMYLSLPISSTCRSLQDCLQLYLAEEMLSGDNQWYCAKCKQHRDAMKKTDLWILPPILIIHLKRFRFNEFGRMGSKNDVPIIYPIEQWNLSSYVRSRGSEHPLYDLYAVSNHIGSLGSGHYTAHALNRFTEQWYEFDDSRYRQVDERALRGNRGSAYVLFYNRSQGADASDGGSSASSSGRAPVIRRQSVSRPDLWPHTQVQDREFRSFKRRSSRRRLKLPPPPPFAASGGSSAGRLSQQMVKVDE